MPVTLSWWKLHQAVGSFHQGGVIAYPTEAVYGLGCDPLNEQAVARLLALKQRPVEKGLILIAADFAQLSPFITCLDDARMAAVFDTWPGPYTWLLPAHPDTPYWLTGNHPTLAVRVTAHPHAAALCRACDSPLVSTSANIARQRPARTALQLRQAFGDQLDCLINMPLGNNPRPTEIRDAATGKALRT